MDKAHVLAVLKQHLIEGVNKQVEQIAITDNMPVGVYLPSSEMDCWFCHIPNQRLSMGASRIIAISKATGKVIFDGYCGE